MRDHKLFTKLDGNFSSNLKNWRARTDRAMHIIKLCRTPDTSLEDLNNYASAFAFTFMDDSVNGVRMAGAELLAEIFTIFIEKEWPTNALTLNEVVNIESIINAMPLTKALLVDSQRGFLKSNSWRRRQTYSIMLEFLSKNAVISLQQLFSIFFDDIQAIANDNISNIRLKYCSILENILLHYQSRELLQQSHGVLYYIRNQLKKMIKSDKDMEMKRRTGEIIYLLDIALSDDSSIQTTIDERLRFPDLLEVKSVDLSYYLLILLTIPQLLATLINAFG